MRLALACLGAAAPTAPRRRLRRLVWSVTALGVVGLSTADPGLGLAEEASPPQEASGLAKVLEKAAKHAEQFEEMKRRASYTLRWKMEELDGDGNVDGTKEMVMRVKTTPNGRSTEIVKFTEDGVDKTAQARKDATDPEVAKRRAKRRDVHLPFLASEQPRYVFALAERDPRTPSHVRVSFAAKVPAEDAYKGSAWIDEDSGQILSIGLSLTKNPTFVDHINVTMRFDLPTPLGRAPSSVTWDGRGGFLMFRKHHRGTATITDPQVAF